MQVKHGLWQARHWYPTRKKEESWQLRQEVGEVQVAQGEVQRWQVEVVLSG